MEQHSTHATRYSWLKPEPLSNHHRLVDEDGAVVAEWNVARVGGRTTFTWGGNELVITRAHLLTDNLLIHDAGGARLAVYKGNAYEIKGRVVLADKSVCRFVHVGNDTYAWVDVQDTPLVAIQPHRGGFVPLKAIRGCTRAPCTTRRQLCWRGWAGRVCESC